MALMKKANCEKKVPEDKVSEFLELGYSLLENGRVIKKGKAQTKDDLLIALKEAERKIEILKAENKALADKISELQGQSEKFVCPHCGKEYASEINLNKHIAEKHCDADNPEE